jgi:NADPH:quinone reductase-like Zn-dependent oxidoreductase
VVTKKTRLPQHQSQSLAPNRAGRVHRFGGPEVITLEHLAPATPGAGELLVRVKAAGVGPWDAWIRAGQSAVAQTLPLTLGSDIAGVVEAIGHAVTGFAPGDAVFGVTNPHFTGGYADYAIASAAMLGKKPPTLSHIDAASVPVVAVTAWQALFDQARLTHGQSVLIHGAAGNVGAFAVQLAHRAGLHVHATSSSRDFDYVRSLGADTVLDGRTARFEQIVPPVNAVIDLVGGEMQGRSFAVLRPGGALISAVAPPDQHEAAAHGVRAAFFLVEVTTERLARIAAMIEAGTLVASVGTVLPLADARVAHEMLDGTRPHPRGKIVLQVSG